MMNNTSIEEIKKNFSETLKNLMKNKNNININNLAKKTNIYRGTISSYLYNGTLPNGVNSIKLAQYFGVSISYLFGETKIKEADNLKIGEELGINDKAINNLKQIKEINREQNNKYSDIVNDVLTNIDLYENLIYTTNTILEYRLNDETQNEINQHINANKYQGNKLWRRNNLKLEDYIDILSCQKFLEVYHSYLNSKLFETGILNLGSLSLDDREEALEKELKRIREIKAKRKSNKMKK